MNKVSAPQLYLDVPKSIAQEDLFQRYEFAKRIARVLTTQVTKSSLVVGLYGKWGEGKSSVLNFIESELPKETIVIKFNPWLYSDEQHLLKSFFSSIATALDERITGKKEKIGSFLADYSGLIGAFTQFAGVSTDGLKDVGTKLKENSIEKVRAKINEIIVASNKKLVIFIDDIDRLDVNEIQFIFKVVKLAADFPNTAYILAFDDEMVANALAPKYGSGEGKNSGYLFLDKIIQVPLKLPRINFTVLRAHTLDLVQEVMLSNCLELSDGETADFVNEFDRVFLVKIDNPRAGLRYANSIAFALPLLSGEVNNVDLLLIEAVKVFYPELYDFIKANQDLFLKPVSGDKGDDWGGNRIENRKKFINEALNKYGETQSRKLKELLCNLFPQVMDLFKNRKDSENNYRIRIQEKRICSNFHFNRYFSYVVQKGDVSDIYFSEFLITLEFGTISEIVSKFLEAFEIYEASTLLYKLLYWDTGFSEQQIKNLALTIYKNSNLLPEVDDTTSFGSISWMLTNTIAKAIFNLDPQVRQDFLAQVLQVEVTLVSGVDILYDVFSANEHSYEQNGFTEEQKRQLEKILIEKFKTGLTNDNFFGQLNEINMRWLFFTWKKIDPDELNTLLLNQLRHTREAGIKLLKIFSPSVRRSGADGVLEFKSALKKKDYVELCETIDPNELYDNLVSCYGLLEKDIDIGNLQDRIPYSEEDLVYIFQQYHLTLQVADKE